MSDEQNPNPNGVPNADSDSSPTNPTVHDSPVGLTLGNFKVLRPLRRGGMAAVYVAEQTTMQREVAVKTIPLTGDENFYARFLREVRTIAALEHTHILHVIEFGKAHGYAYLVMQLLDHSLRDYVTDYWKLPLNTASRILTEIASALDFAHSKGVIHRDLKPENVLMDKQDSCFLADFGIAYLVDSQTHLTAEGKVVGTPKYMAPEQAHGDKATAASDIYALGVILYEMVCGRPLFGGDNAFVILRQHMDDPPESPRTYRPDLPPEAEKALLTALAKAPENRFSSARAFARAFADAVAGIRADPTRAESLNRDTAPTADMDALTAPDSDATLPPGAATTKGDFADETLPREQQTDASTFPPETVDLENQITATVTPIEGDTMQLEAQTQTRAFPFLGKITGINRLVFLVITLILLGAAAFWVLRPEQTDEPVISREQAIAHTESGLTAFNNLDYDSAIERFEEAIQSDPSYAAAYFNLGVTYEELGDLESAREAYESAFDKGEEPPLAAYYRLAELLMDMDDIDRGFQLADQGVRLLRRTNLEDGTQQILTFWLYTARGRAYYLQGQYTLAEGDFKQAEVVASTITYPAELYYYLALTYVALEKEDEALNAWLDLLAKYDVDNDRHRAWADEARAAISN